MSSPSKRQLAAGQIRSLRAMRKKILDMSTQWEELDQFCVNVLEELADHCATVATDLVADAGSEDL